MQMSTLFGAHPFTDHSDFAFGVNLLTFGEAIILQRLSRGLSDKHEAGRKKRLHKLFMNGSSPFSDIAKASSPIPPLPFYLYSRNIVGTLERSGTWPCHSFTERVRMNSPSHVMPAAMHSRVCGRQVARMVSTSLLLR